MWCVELRNAGNAPARFVGLSCFAEGAGTRIESAEALDVRAMMDDLNFVDERDNLLVRLSPQFVLPAGGTQRVYELLLPLAREFGSASWSTTPAPRSPTRFPTSTGG